MAIQSYRVFFILATLITMILKGLKSAAKGE